MELSNFPTTEIGKISGWIVITLNLAGAFVNWRQIYKREKAQRVIYRMKNPKVGQMTADEELRGHVRMLVGLGGLGEIVTPNEARVLAGLPIPEPGTITRT